ncbi:MAG: hypothetical protein WB716_11855 [Candidatus Acidiferrales bacterium]
MNFGRLLEDDGMHANPVKGGCGCKPSYSPAYDDYRNLWHRGIFWHLGGGI